MIFQQFNSHFTVIPVWIAGIRSRMTLRYAHLAPERKAAAVARLVRLATPADSGPADLAAYRQKKAASGADVP
jgi:hypothetical protein